MRAHTIAVRKMEWEIVVEKSPFLLKPGKYTIQLSEKLIITFSNEECEEKREMKQLENGRIRIVASRTYKDGFTKVWTIEMDDYHSCISSFFNAEVFEKTVKMYGIDGAVEVILSIIRSSIEEVFRFAPPRLTEPIEYAA